MRKLNRLTRWGEDMSWQNCRDKSGVEEIKRRVSFAELANKKSDFIGGGEREGLERWRGLRWKNAMVRTVGNKRSNCINFANKAIKKLIR